MAYNLDCYKDPHAPNRDVSCVNGGFSEGARRLLLEIIQSNHLSLVLALSRTERKVTK